jgi:hypothetical protein
VRGTGGSLHGGGVVACQQNGAENTALIDNISLPDAGNAYSFDGAKLTISYHKGETTAEVDLPIDISVTYAEEQTGVYISDEKIAVAYGGLDGQSPVKVMVSGDMGKSWNRYIHGQGFRFNRRQFYRKKNWF